eukprot:1140840-Pelagomonas_calceolata.AAC.15
MLTRAGHCDPEGCYPAAPGGAEGPHGGQVWPSLQRQATRCAKQGDQGHASGWCLRMHCAFLRALLACTEKGDFMTAHLNQDLAIARASLFTATPLTIGWACVKWHSAQP